jgi:hypothetical protein
MTPNIKKLARRMIIMMMHHMNTYLPVWCLEEMLLASEYPECLPE